MIAIVAISILFFAASEVLGLDNLHGEYDVERIATALKHSKDAQR